MTIVVPFDESDLAREALRRATQIKHDSETVVALVVIPDENAEYARNRGWMGPDEEFRAKAIVADLTDRVRELAPEATFEYIVTDRYASNGQIANKLRRYAVDVGARLVVIGSDNAGRIVSSLGSIGRRVATNTTYDILIVRSQTNRSEED
jgi:nucleotide-binding universal stress UspA family protein